MFRGRIFCKSELFKFFFHIQHYRPTTNDSNKHSFIHSGGGGRESDFRTENMFFFRSFFFVSLLQIINERKFFGKLFFLSKKQQETCKVFVSTTTKITNFVFFSKSKMLNDFSNTLSLSLYVCCWSKNNVTQVIFFFVLPKNLPGKILTKNDGLFLLLLLIRDIDKRQQQQMTNNNNK